MIIDRLENAGIYANLHPDFAVAFEFLRASSGKHLEPGRHDIDGDRVFAIVQTATGHGADEARLEVHRRYIDIQLTVSGMELYGWRSLRECLEVSEAFRESDDLGFYTDEVDSWLSAPPGTFLVFLPEDAHAPLCGEGPMEKIIVKVAVQAG